MGKTKQEMRAQALALRDALNLEARRLYSESIWKNLTDMELYREAEAILTYVSFRSEVETLPLIEQALSEGKAVFAPKVTRREMVFYRLFAPEELTGGYQGILEPEETVSYIDWVSQLEAAAEQDTMSEDSEGKVAADPVRRSKPSQTLVIMPGAAFDRAHHRIGYGGGFYDRYLARLAERTAGDGRTPEIHTAALAFSCQIFAELPCEEYDVCPEWIVTEQGVL